MGEGERVGDEGEEMGVKGKKTEKEGGEDCVGCDDQACARLRALRQRREIVAFCFLFIAACFSCLINLVAARQLLAIHLS